MKQDPYIKNCLIKSRDGETLFDAQTAEAFLDGYAIIPIEEYRRLTEDSGAENIEINIPIDGIFKIRSNAKREDFKIDITLTNRLEVIRIISDITEAVYDFQLDDRLLTGVIVHDISIKIKDCKYVVSINGLCNVHHNKIFFCKKVVLP